MSASLNTPDPPCLGSWRLLLSWCSLPLSPLLQKAPHHYWRGKSQAETAKVSPAMRRSSSIQCATEAQQTLPAQPFWHHTCSSSPGGAATTLKTCPLHLQSKWSTVENFSVTNSWEAAARCKVGFILNNRFDTCVGFMYSTTPCQLTR